MKNILCLLLTLIGIAISHYTLIGVFGMEYVSVMLGLLVITSTVGFVYLIVIGFKKLLDIIVKIVLY